ncbi:MAG: 16S rRNA (cytosine(1402)-N(4))-methyltransferase [Butyricicoccus sp.]
MIEGPCREALREKQHPAKRSFQAIRIAVNDERECGKRWCIDCLNPAADWRSSPSQPATTSSGGTAGGTGLHLSEGLSGMHLRQKPKVRLTPRKPVCRTKGK